jgi:hypothetical protein
MENNYLVEIVERADNCPAVRLPPVRMDNRYQ